MPVGLTEQVTGAGLAERELEGAGEWTSDAIEDAAHVYSHLSHKARQVFDLLMDNEARRWRGNTSPSSSASETASV